ncbi:poly-gamma-glutamate biosynthesis protein PgsC/CapC [Azospirillum sp. sgz302134]
MEWLQALFPLPVFPEGSLSSSVITTTWVGVHVIAFFNLRFGWVLSGLVVPGYLVPLMIARPWSAAVIMVEAAVTYLLVWLVSERLSGGATWSSIFGRDRFMALVLCSIVVRLGFDAWLLPVLGQYLDDRFGLAFDWRHNLQSFGLIVIALLANQFWKPGFLRGLFPVAVTLGLTYLIVRYGLMEFTNFRISGIAYLYEGIATSVLASPKAYVILVVTAFLASRMNLLYGWEFNGILIPALIALQWYQPVKVLSSFVEAFVIYGLAALVLRTPVFASVTMEGARKILLFFNISFAYKMALAYALHWSGLEVKITDYYGFGYLLSTLMAIKMFDKNILARFTRATLQISLTGVAAGSLVGFALAAFLPVAAVTPGTAATEPVPVRDRKDSLAHALAAARVGVYAHWSADRADPPAPEEAEGFRRAVARLLEPGGTAPDALREVSGILHAIGYRAERVEGHYLLLREEAPGRGWGAYVITTDAPDSGGAPLVVEVPDPLESRGLADAGTALFRDLGARALAVAGTSPSLSGDSMADARLAYQSLFQAFHEAVAGSVLQLRGPAEKGGGEGAPVLRIVDRVPETLDLPRLERAAGTLRTEWGRPPARNIQRQATTGGFAELTLAPPASARIVAASLPPDRIGREGSGGRLQGLLLERLSEPGRIAEAGSNAYAPPRLDQLLYIDAEVLRPLLSDILAGRAPTAEDLAAAGLAASALGYQLSIHEGGGRRTLLLTEAEGGERHWGTVAIALDPDAAPYLVEVPHPLAELNTLEFGLSLFAQLGARALLVAGADPRANGDGSANVTLPTAPPNLFSLVNQAILRESGDRPLMAVQSRAFGVPEDGVLPPHDALLALDRTELGRTELGRTELGPARMTPLAQGLADRVSRAGIDLGLVDGRLETAGYGVGQSRQTLYLGQTRGKEFAVLWLSPLLRGAYAQRDEAQAEQSLFDTLGIPTAEADPADRLAEAGARTTPLPDGLRALLTDYLDRRDGLALRRVQQGARGYRLERLIDPNSRQSFLMIAGADGAVAALVNLTPADPESEERFAPARLDRAQVARFIDSRTAWLLPERGGGG